MISFLKVSFFSACLTLFKTLMLFVIAKVIAVYTGPSGMALLGQLQSFIVGINGVVNSPVGNGVVKFTAEHKSRGYEACSDWWKAALTISFIFSVILIVACIPFTDWISNYLFASPSYRNILIVAVACLPLTAIGTLILSVINGLGNFKRFIFFGLVATLLSSIVMLILLKMKGIEGALFAVSIQYGLIGVVLLIANFHQKWFKIKYFSLSLNSSFYIKDILSYVYMALTSAISLPITLIIIRNILVDNTNFNVAGQWQAVWRISEAYIGIITIALSTYFLPKLSAITTRDDMNREIHMVLKLVLPAVVVMGVIIYLCRDIIIVLLFTSDFSEARDYFLIQLIGDTIKIVSWIYAFAMLSQKATKWYIGTELFFCIMWVVFSYLLIPHFQAQGINIAYSLSYLFYFLIIYFNFNNIVKLK
jgi:PST family polysaccharide transporter